MNAAPDLIASSEASKILGCSRRTFNRRVAAGHIVPAIVAGEGEKAARLFSRAQIEALAAAARPALTPVQEAS